MQKYIKGQGDDVNTVIVRPASTTLLGISSNDRYKDWASRRTNPTNPFSILIQKNQAIMNGYFRRIAMTEFRMNWTIPNFAQAWGNNTVNISYINAGTTYTFPVTLFDGFYGAEDIATAMQALIVDGTPTVPGIPGFTVQINFPKEDDLMYFSSPYPFWFTPTSGSQRQLFDMLALPTLGSPGVISMLTGIPDLRATEYVDLVSSQLTNNMLQKDSTSAPIVRDMIARIYLDDDVPSQALVSTNYYNITYASTTSSTYVLIDENTVRYTVASTAGFSNGALVSISGLTGGINWTGTNVGNAIIISATVMDVLYGAVVSGTATGTATINSSNQGAVTQTSTPQTTWDDRVNGVTPFTLYRQFPYPKQIRWEHTQPIGNLRFELFDSQGRSMADLWGPYSSGTVVSHISGATYTTSTISSTFAPVGNTVVYLLPSPAGTLGFAVGQTVSISGTTGGTGFNTTGRVTVVSGNSVTVLYSIAPTGIILSLVGSRMTANTVNYTVSTSTGFQLSQFAVISGLDGGVGGFDGTVTINSIPDATHIVVNYSPDTYLSGTPPSDYTYATIQSTIDYQSSFAWNCSILCSED